MRLHTGLLLLALAVTAQAQPGLYKWMDESGRVQYSDHPPIQPPRSGTAELSHQGMVRQPAETPEARKAREAAAAARKAEEERLRLEARQDKVLLESYRTEADLRRERERQIGTVQSGINALQLRREALARRLADYERDAAGFRRQNKAVPPALDTNRRIAAQEQRDLDQQLMQRQQEAVQLRSRMEADLARYRQLRPQPSVSP